MIDYKAAYNFKDGQLEIYPPIVEGLPANEIVPIVSLVNSIGMTLEMTVFPEKQLVNGVIYLHHKNGKISLDYDITPEDSIQVFRDELKKKHSRLDV